MQKFSERYGYTELKQIEREHVCEEIRNQIWNVLVSWYNCNSSLVENLVKLIWISYKKKPIDEVPTKRHSLLDSYFCPDISYIKKELLNTNWYKFLNLLEFIANNLDSSFRQEFLIECNMIFEKECSTYRFVNGYINEISGKEEIEEIEEALLSLQLTKLISI